jgi:hypothetical protein
MLITMLTKVDDLGTETESATFQKLFYHKINTPQVGAGLVLARFACKQTPTLQDQDVLCYETPDHAKWMSHAEVTSDGKAGQRCSSVLCRHVVCMQANTFWSA